MGGWWFTDMAHGATWQDAFHNAGEQAAWEHGHGGYTGTIAEKHECVFFDIKARGLSFKRFMKLFDAYRAWKYDSSDFGSVEGWKTSKSKPAGVTDYEMTKTVKGGKTVERSYRWYSNKKIKVKPCPVPSNLVSLMERVYDVTDDKWGPCAVVEVDDAETLRQYRVTHGLTGKRNVHVYYFFGWASS